MTPHHFSRRALLGGAAACALTACTNQANLSPAPKPNDVVLGDIASPSSVNLLYFTDQKFENGNFTAGRSRGVIYGEGTVTLGEGKTNYLTGVREHQS